MHWQEFLPFCPHSPQTPWGAGAAGRGQCGYQWGEVCKGERSYTPFLYYLPVLSEQCLGGLAVEEAFVDASVRQSDCKGKCSIVHVLEVADNSRLELNQAFSVPLDSGH